ncbi:MAG: nuclear transport factor 2 family protein [Myxococcota bacterium]
MDLHEIRRIEELKYRYLRCLDQKRWDEILECFTSDATAAYSGGRYSFRGRDEIVAFLRRAMGRESFLSSHRVHHPEIELTAADRATGTWALDDCVVDVEHGVTIRGAAFYEDVYHKLDGRWKISHTGYRRSWEEVEARDRVRLTASWWGTGGRSELPVPD